MEKSETIGKIAEALARAQGEIKPAAFDATNPHFKSKYATLGAIVESCKDALSKNGIAVMQGTNSVDGRVIVETMLAHTSGEWIKSSLSMKTERDNGNGEMPAIPEDKRQAIKLELGDVLWYVSCLGKALGFELAEIADANIEKLASRQNRGVIGGSGDMR